MVDMTFMTPNGSHYNSGIGLKFKQDKDDFECKNSVTNVRYSSNKCQWFFISNGFKALTFK